MADTKEYNRGYQAGRRKAENDNLELREQLRLCKIKASEREERIFMQCLEMALKNCGNWTIGKKEINNAEGYCRLAKIFADNAIAEMDS